MEKGRLFLHALGLNFNCDVLHLEHVRNDAKVRFEKTLLKVYLL